MAAPLGFLAVFLLLCANYGARVQLWGDETYALNVAAQPLDAILAADPFHLPTYYLALHPIAPLFPAGLEWPLRLLHALIFSIGLLFCWRLAQSFLGRGWALWGVMGLTILLPNYIFYAINLRMYAPLFAASQAFLWTTFQLLEPGGPRRRRLIGHLLAAALCALIDWPGLLLVGLTWAALLALKGRSLLARGGLSRRLLASLGGLALVGAVLFREPLLRLLLEWPRQGARAAAGFSLGAAAKSLFFGIRPLLDLVYPPGYPLALNLLLWLLLALALPVAAVVLWRRGEARERLVVVLALSWLVGSPLGFAVTRGFLPAQFFTLLCLALALRRGGGGSGSGSGSESGSASASRGDGGSSGGSGSGGRSGSRASGGGGQTPGRRLWAPLIWGCLIAVGLANLQQAVAPTLRLYSRIPFPTIARDAVAAARDRQLPLIAVSRHTLNALSVERFARPELAAGQELRLLAVRPTCADFPRGTFVYVRLMPEDGEDSDPRRACAGQAEVTVEPLRAYVDFAELAYNPLWASNLKDRGEGAAAAELLIVTIPPAADGTNPGG